MAWLRNNKSICIKSATSTWYSSLKTKKWWEFNNSVKQGKKKKKMLNSSYNRKDLWRPWVFSKTKWFEWHSQGSDICWRNGSYFHCIFFSSKKLLHRLCFPIYFQCVFVRIRQALPPENASLTYGNKNVQQYKQNLFLS